MNPYLLLALGVVATSGPSAELSTAWTPVGRRRRDARVAQRTPGISDWSKKLRENYDVVSASDHEWCTLTRDNWACVGGAYAAVLNRTRPYRPWRFQLANLPLGTRVFADGNSYLAERMTTLLCGCHSTDVFKFDVTVV
ncbi:carbamoyltransferase [Aureococcus anophagefferens]|nr:carbamoyltransferase [Aureococcus anophagefferens]